MNRDSLENFIQEVNQIEEYIKHIKYVNSVAAYPVKKVDDDDKEFQQALNNLNKHYKKFRLDKHIFEYKASIISLYGILEKYVETWIKEYLDTLSNIIPDYNLIDREIRDNHFELSLKLINILLSRENAKISSRIAIAVSVEHRIKANHNFYLVKKD